jgi:hypothetical protein
MMNKYRVQQDNPDLFEFPYIGRDYVVLEMGGLDGVTYSNSYIFEKYLGWRAIHFEVIFLYLIKRPIPNHIKPWSRIDPMQSISIWLLAKVMRFWSSLIPKTVAVLV